MLYQPLDHSILAFILRGRAIWWYRILQAKAVTVALNRLGLANIDAKYRLLAGKKPIVQQTQTTFSVILPLFLAEIGV